jgi:nitroreductase
MSVEELTDPLARFLDEIRLRFDPRTVPAPAPSPRHAEHPLAYVVSDVLGVGYGERPGSVITKGHTRTRARTTPSAGALYPFEVLVALREADRYRLHLYDIAGNCLYTLPPLPAAEMAGLLAPHGDGTDPDAALVFAVVGRPWLSMGKYGRRGYLYSQLDGAHAATSIALAAAHRGLRPTVRLRFDRRRAAAALGLEGLCREPQSLITCASPAGDAAHTAAAPANPFAVPVWRHDSEPRFEQPTAEEHEAWQGLSPVSAYYGGIPRAPRFGPVTSIAAPGPVGERRPVPLAAAGALEPRGFQNAAVTRTSAKGFQPRPLAADQLGKVLSGLRHGLVADCADGPAPGLRLLVRDVTGIAPGAYAYAPDTHELRPVRGGARPAADVAAACQNQAVVRHAAALLALHVPLEALLGPYGRQVLAEVHFHAASAAHRIGLQAAAHAVGATSLGGFDSARVADLTALASHDEVVYVLALGVPDPSAVKWDRAPIAYSHGFGPGSRTDRTPTH